MLLLDRLTHFIGNKKLFTNLSVSILPASVLYIHGKNGSGKTSLLRMVANIGAPSEGNIFYRKSNIDNLARPYCNYIGHNLGLQKELTVLENLKYYSSFYNSLETLEASIHYFNLYNILNAKCYELSYGNQKKVALSTLLSCQSDLWLLDEVETNLDDENKRLLNNMIVSKANHGGIILITTHDIPNIKASQSIYIEDYKA